MHPNTTPINLSQYELVRETDTHWAYLRPTGRAKTVHIVDRRPGADDE